jgi:hypothetical protein
VEWRAWLTPPPLQVSTGAAPLCVILPPPPTLSWTARSGPPLPQYHLPRAAVRSSGAHQPHRQAPRSLLRRETPPPKPPSRRPMASVSHRRYLLARRDPHIPLMLESPPAPRRSHPPAVVHRAARVLGDCTARARIAARVARTAWPFDMWTEPASQSLGPKWRPSTVSAFQFPKSIFDLNF